MHGLKTLCAPWFWGGTLLSLLLVVVTAGASQARPPHGLASQAGGQHAGADLPQILPWPDVRLYRKVFALQEAGDWPAADRQIARISDPLLLGHVQAQRYLHPTAYRSAFGELHDWLVAYTDHPQARRIFKLALKRKPTDATAPPEPPALLLKIPAAADGAVASYRTARARSDEEHAKVKAIKQEIRKSVADKRLVGTELLLRSTEAKSLLDPVELDQGYAYLAAAWLFDGEDEKALNLASATAWRSGPDVPSAHWTAGLAAWRLDEMGTAAGHFEQAASSARASAWGAAAAAYWAARAHQRLRRPGDALLWLMRASDYPRTFYGLLARHQLGGVEASGIQPTGLSDRLVERILAEPGGRRLFALLQIGQRERALQELEHLAKSADTALGEALIALAEEARFPEQSVLIASRFVERTSLLWYSRVERGLYPLPPWAPDEGYLVDRALIYAFMRHESRFDPQALSKDGARGLMQLMPQTAAFVAGEPDFEGREDELHDPALNIDLGQRYLRHLLDRKSVKGDLFRLSAAYNGGPGNLARWASRLAYNDDPLLFIESLPSGETRSFVERVLTNLWIYRARLGQPSPSLDALAEGEWPRYTPLDQPSPELASYGSD